MSTIVTKPLFPIMLAFAALLSAHQQAAAQTPIKESVTQTPGFPLLPPKPPANAETRQYGCGFGVQNQFITAKVTNWYVSGISIATVTDVHITKYPNSPTASASLTISATGASGQTYSGIPMDGNWHSSTIYVAGNAGPRLTALMEKPWRNGCNLSAMEP